MRTLILFLVAVLSGCGSGDENNPVADDVIIDDNSEQRLDQVNVSDAFDWSTSSEYSIHFQLVSSLSEVNGTKTHLGGKHLLRVTALNENYDMKEGYLLQSLTDVTGQLLASIKLKQTWRGIRVVTRVNDVGCVRDILAEDIMPHEEITCDIETGSDW